MTQGVESQCDQHDAVKSALQIPLPLSHKNIRFKPSNILNILAARGFHLCGLSAKMTNEFFWTKKRSERAKYGQ